MNLSHLTAIKRTSLSSPTKYLVKQGRLKGRLLDFGCGKGFDCDYLKYIGLDCEGYDPHYRPQEPIPEYDTIFCNYVLNVLPEDSERKDVLKKIQSLLNNDGRGYVAVRNDTKSLNGWTKIGTFQCLVTLELPEIVVTRNFRMYVVEKHSILT